MTTNELDAFTAPKKARVEIIPLIDVVFFLLATFVLFTLSLNKLSTLPVQLPVAPIGPIGEDFTTLYIQTSETGTLYVRVGTKSAAEPMAAEELPARLKLYKHSVSTPRVFIRSDNKAKFKDAVLVLDEVRRAGIAQVSIETMSSPTGG